MARRRHDRMLPVDLYARYPNVDILPIAVPTPLTEWCDWHMYMINCGDGLFSFLIRELSDTCDWKEALSRIEAVAYDVHSVLTLINQQAELASD